MAKTYNFSSDATKFAAAAAGFEAARESTAQAIGACVRSMQAHGVKFGKSMRTCAYSKEVNSALIAAGLAKGTAANYLSAVRAAVNDNKPFTLNASRDASKTAEKKKTSARQPAGSTWKSVGEVTDALAKAITAVQDKAGPDLWIQALNTTPEGFKEAIQDFLTAQGGPEPGPEPERKTRKKTKTRNPV